jgi:hypothetical protein
MTVAFAGLRGTGDFSADERPKNFRELILRTDPNGQAPVFALTSKMNSEETDDPEFAWWEEGLFVPRVKVSAGLSSAAASTGLELQTSAVVTDGSTRGTGLSFVVGDILLVEKVFGTTYNNEVVIVTAVNSQTSLTIQRAACGTTADGIPANAYLTKIGNAYAEGTNSPTVASRNPVKKHNYTQIFKTAFEITGTAESTRFRTGNPLKNDEIRKSFDHAAAVEYALIFGRRQETVGSNAKPLRFTGGLLDPNIGIPITVFATTPTEDAYLDSLEPMFQTTMPGISNERMGFCGNGYLNALNKQIKNSASTRIMFNGILKVYGMQFQRFVTPYGEIALKTHPLFNTHGLFTKCALILAPQLITWRALKGRDTKKQMNIQANDADTKKGQYLTEGGLEVAHPQHMRFHSITTI